MISKLKRKIKWYFNHKLLTMKGNPQDCTKVPSCVNDNFNKILSLNPRVTSFQEQISLYTLSSLASGDVIEIGCYLGYSSVIMASGFSDPNRKLYAIDTFDRLKGWSAGGSDNWIFKDYSQLEFAEKTINECRLSDQIILKHGYSGDFADEMAKLSNVGMIFVDGNHSYEGCRSDIESYSPILSDGGYLVMHDYNAKKCPGVKRATDEFLAEQTSFTPQFLVNSMLVIKKN